MGRDFGRALGADSAPSTFVVSGDIEVVFTVASRPACTGAVVTGRRGPLDESRERGFPSPRAGMKQVEREVTMRARLIFHGAAILLLVATIAIA